MDMAFIKFPKGLFYSFNVQVTGAARLHRAASSDRRERGRPAGYAFLRRSRSNAERHRIKLGSSEHKVTSEVRNNFAKTLLSS